MLAPSSSSHSKWSAFGPWALLIISSAAVYLNTLGYEFVWDDLALILEDHTVKSFKYLDAIFTSDFFGHHEDDLVYGYFRPIVSLSYVLDYSIWQKNPFGYHFVNLCFHTGATVLSASALLMMRLPRSIAFGAAFLFAVHPIHAENVAWISGRTDLLAFLFALGALVVHLRTCTASGRVRFFKFFSFVLFAAALLSKEMAVVLIPWIIIAEAAFLERRVSRALLSSLPYVGILGLYLIWRFGVVGVAIPAGRVDVSFWDKLFSAPWTIVRYLSWLVLPINQSAYVQNPYMGGPFDWRLYVGMAGLGGLAYLIWRLRHVRSGIVGLSIMLGVSFGPILNFVAISSPGDMGNTMAERFLYFPSFPFVAIAALGLDAARQRLSTRVTPHLIFVFIGAIIVGLGAATVKRNRVWQSNEVFYTSTLESTPSALLWCNLANHYIYERKWQQAKSALTEAKKYHASDYHYLSSMALWHVAQGQYREAVTLQKKVADNVKRGRAVAYNNLAFLYRMTGDYKKARHLLEEIIFNNCAYGDVYFNLGTVHAAEGRDDDAIQAYRRALTFRPDNISYATSLGTVLMRKGALESAAALFAEQLEMHRGSPGLLNNLGIVNKKMNRLDRAISLFRAALDTDPTYAKARLNLAGALLSVNRQSAAIIELRRVAANHRATPEGAQAEALLETIGKKENGE